MGIEKRTPFLVCDMCGKEEECKWEITKYHMKRVTVEDFNQSGDGSLPYDLINRTVYVVCESCFEKTTLDSVTPYKGRLLTEERQKELFPIVRKVEWNHIKKSSLSS
jgi:hypothetical protein